MQRLIPALALVLFASSAAAQNAPFCAVDATGTRCWYYDMQECRRAVGTSGACVVNNTTNQSQSSQGQSDWFNNATRSYESGQRQRQDRESYQQPSPQVVTSQPSPNATWVQFCERMQQNDLDVLSHWGERLTAEEREVATRMYANRATYCRSLAQ